MMQNAATETDYLIRPYKYLSDDGPRWTLFDRTGVLYHRGTVQELVDMVWAGAVRPYGRTVIEIRPTREGK